MTLDVICDVVIQGESKLLKTFQKQLYDTFAFAITNTGLVLENYELLSNEPESLQIFFTTRYEPPTMATKNLASTNQNLVFILTYDDQIGNHGRIRFQGATEIKLEYISEFQKSLNNLVLDGTLPAYGVVFTSNTESDLHSKILQYTEEHGYKPNGESDKDDSGFAIDWLVENIGGEYGCFEIENLSLIFRPWEIDEL